MYKDGAEATLQLLQLYPSYRQDGHIEMEKGPAPKAPLRKKRRTLKVVVHNWILK